MENRDVKFYAYFADYDWVVFCQLFGIMNNLPKGFPMYCIDLKQNLDNKVRLASSLSGETFEDSLKRWKLKSNYPKQTNEHNALSDARWNKELNQFIETL